MTAQNWKFVVLGVTLGLVVQVIVRLLLER